MSFTEDIKKSIDNGLEIAEFIQTNREAIQETYGRSTIEKPTSKERIRAWEAFIAEKSSSNAGHEGDKESSSGAGDESAEPSQMGDRDAAGEISPPNILISSSSRSGSDYSRDDSDFDLSDQVTEIINRTVIEDDSRRGNTDTSRDGQSQHGSRDHQRDPEPDSGSDNESRDSIREATHKGVKRVIAIKETTADDLKEIMDEVNTVPTKRVQNMSEIIEGVDKIKAAPRVIKKTTDKSSASTSTEEKQLSDNGATQCVQRSRVNLDFKNVGVGNAQKNAPIVMMETINEEASDTSDLGTIDSTASKLDEILTNQKKILDKLLVLSEIKEEINSIKKTLVNQGIALSTIENYISDMMIIIPKSGEPNENSSVTVNPDLKMVIGRDRNRGLKEVTRDLGSKDKIEIDEDLFVVPTLNEDYMINPINMKINNASNFVPTDDVISVSIIKGIIESEVGDPDLIDQLYELVDTGVEKIPVKEVYKNIRKLLDDMHQVDRQYTPA